MYTVILADDSLSNPGTFFWLQNIEVSEKRFAYVEPDAFKGLMCLQSLIIRRCQLTQMPPLEPIKTLLMFLRLRMNNISNVPQNYFEGFSQLKHLYLSSNLLSKLPNIQPLNSSLVILDLSVNIITSLSVPYNEQVFKFLKIINLMANLLTTFDIGSLSLWPALSDLDISANCLTTVPNITDFNTNRSQQTVLNVWSNVIDCTSDIVWLFDGLQRNESIGNSYTRSSIVLDGFMYSKCAKPEHLSGRSLGHLSKRNIHE